MMVEQIFKLTKGNEKAVEKVVSDENIHYLHMVFNQTRVFLSTFPILTYI